MSCGIRGSSSSQTSITSAIFHRWTPRISSSSELSTSQIFRASCKSLIERHLVTKMTATVEGTASGHASALHELRIACLEPSATAICLELGLGDNIVGVTHECEPVLADYYSKHGSDSALEKKRPIVLTKSGLTVTSQADIHEAVQKTAAAAAVVASKKTCPVPTKDGDESPLSSEIPSTYPLLEERMQAARPTVIFTQDLCDVCAPTTADVRRCLLKNSENSDEKQETVVDVVALQPTTLHEVADTFVTIAKACGVLDRGMKLKDDFLNNLKALRDAIQANRNNNQDSSTMPSMFILEWLDPVFDSGHWTCKLTCSMLFVKVMSDCVKCIVFVSAVRDLKNNFSMLSFYINRPNDGICMRSKCPSGKENS